TENEKEVEVARNKYAELRRIIEEHNEKLLRDGGPKSELIGPGTFSVIDNMEERETGNIRYRQDTAALMIELERQRELWQDFESWKQDLGEASARQRYAKELNLVEGFQKRVAEEMGVLMARSVSAGLTGPEQERLKGLIGLGDEINQQQQRDRDANLKRVLAD